MPRASQARELALEVTLAVTRDGAYANLALPAALARSGLDERDRAFATELVYGSLRAQGELDVVVEEATKRKVSTLEPEVLSILRLGVYQLLRMRVENHASVDESVRLAKSGGLHRVSGLVNAALRAVASEPLDYWDRVIERSTATEHSHPHWIVNELRRALTECAGEGELADALQAHNQAPLVTLCHLPGLSTPTATRRTPYSPLGSILEGGDPSNSDGVAEHRVRVQDEGSQLAALLLSRVSELGPDSKIWDMCAGPGGKTALLGAEAAGVGATVLATEISAHRAALVQDSTRALRSRFPGVVEVEIADATSPQGRTFDRVLLDAPCSGLGALRRRPEARWTKSPESIPGLVALQEALLRRGLGSLRVGGVLAYVTCSPVVEETTALVAGVTHLDDHFLLLDTPAVVDRISVKPMPPHTRGTAVQLWTHRHGTDAMFVQLIKRLR